MKKHWKRWKIVLNLSVNAAMSYGSHPHQQTQCSGVNERQQKYPGWDSLFLKKLIWHPDVTNVALGG